MLIFAGENLVMRINGKHGVHRGVLTNPCEGLHPRVRRLCKWQLEVWRSSIHLPLGEKHAGGERNKEQGPAIRACSQDVLSQQSAGDDEEKDVQEVQVAHRLERTQPL